ncbi:MAG: right-handed parallel beta-helix repeat-containing protein, partial [Oscillospiraceae bacterium]|nr:right-handed parallel beta-helix repeat-containing protein [Oscillospiraceae bacterium]
APGGSDTADGTQSAPLATLAAARDKIRALKLKSGLPDGGIAVYIRGGTYDVAGTTYFTAEDSGTAAAPIVYAAYPGETPLFTGGKYLAGSAFAPISDAAMLSRLASDARENVVALDLFANGFTFDDLDYSKPFWEAGQLREYVPEDSDIYDAHDNAWLTRRMQVFLDDDALDLARYPNRVPGIFAENPYLSYLRIPDVIASGFDPTTERLTGENSKFTTRERRVKSWASLEDVIITGMTGWEFFSDKVLAKTIDAAAMTIELRGAAMSGVTKGSRYAFENVFEELDAPGEYFISREGVLYLYPAKNLDGATVKVSKLDENFIIDAENLSHVTFSGLTLELTKGSVMYIRGGRGVTVENCVIKNIGTNGIRLGEYASATRDLAGEYGQDGGYDEETLTEAARNGFDHKILSSTFLNIGYNAAKIASGSALSRESGGALFEGNSVIHTGLLGSTYNSGVNIEGCGITVKNNLFAFCLGQAIQGNVVDTSIIYNEFVDSPCDMGEDTGTIYLNYVGLNDGVQVRYNYFHDVTGIDHPGVGFDFARRGGGAYYDTEMPFQDFSYNVLYNVPSAPQPINPTGPWTNVGNIYIDVPQVFEYPPESLRDAEGTDWGSPQWALENVEVLNRFNNNRFWSEKYPELTEYFGYIEKKSDINALMSDIRDNIVVNINAPRSGRSYWYAGDWVSDWAGRSYPPLADAPVDEKYGKIENNLLFDTDPGFADYAAKDFQLSKDTAKKLGVEWLDMGKIGVPGAPKFTRLSDAYADKDTLSGVKFDAHFEIGFPDTDVERHETGYFKQVSLWREVAPGAWEWVNESGLNTESSAGIFVRPGANYAVFFHGDSTHPPQFAGVVAENPDGAVIVGAQRNIPAEAFTPPPEGVTKFRVTSSCRIDFKLDKF